MNKFVIYTSHEEVIVTTVKKEAETIRLYFTEGGRDLDDYDRVAQNTEAVMVSFTARASY